MFERFTDDARKVMALANEQVRRFGHEYIGTEHILLGLLKENSSTGATILKDLGVDIEKLLAEVEQLYKKVAKPGKKVSDKAASQELRQLEGAKNAIKYAIEEARALEHNYIGTEHILLGLLRETNGIAAQVLTNLGVKLEDVREKTRGTRHKT